MSSVLVNWVSDNVEPRWQAKKNPTLYVGFFVGCDCKLDVLSVTGYSTCDSLASSQPAARHSRSTALSMTIRASVFSLAQSR